MTAVPLPWWSQLDDAIATSKHLDGYSRTQLSTIRGPLSGRLCGRPAVRTVNIRLFSDRKLYFVSDLRSGKADDVKDGPSGFCELVWYFPECKKQFRISGRLVLRQGDELTRDTWRSMSYHERKWWTWPTPAERRAERTAFLKPASEEPPGHFCVGLIEADHVDVLDLAQAPFMRELHNREQTAESKDKLPDWASEIVNP